MAKTEAKNVTEASETASETGKNGKDKECNMTKQQDREVDLSESSVSDDNLADDANQSTDAENNSSTEKETSDSSDSEPSLEEKYNSLNDSHLRLMAEFDNYRKRTLKEKADLIKSGGANVLSGILPVIDDFERAMSNLEKLEESAAALEGVKLIYDKFISFLSQQGVKKMDVVGEPFNVDSEEAIAMIPAPDEDKKGKVIDCVQTGYMLYDKVLRHAKVVVGE